MSTFEQTHKSLAADLRGAAKADGSPWIRHVIFAVVVTTLGMGAAGFGYGFFGPSREAGLVNPPIWPPRWLFWGIWLVLYPVTGIAGSYLWALRGADIRARAAYLLFWAGLAAGFLWVPIVQASGDCLVTPVVMDLIGGTVGLAAFVYALRVSRTAACWLVPLNTWGLLTTILKIWRLALNV